MSLFQKASNLIANVANNLVKATPVANGLVPSYETLTISLLWQAGCVA
jgi:hypothetical protein